MPRLTTTLPITSPCGLDVAGVPVVALPPFDVVSVHVPGCNESVVRPSASVVPERCVSALPCSVAVTTTAANGGVASSLPVTTTTADCGVALSWIVPIVFDGLIVRSVVPAVGPKWS